MAVIGVIATLDTKGPETAFLKEKIEESGHQALILDSGMLFEPAICPDITRHEILKMGGVEDLESSRKNGKAALQRAMTEGLKNMLIKLYEEKQIQGILSVGGGQGSAMSTAAMQVLPIGFPKVMVSTIACGSACFGDYVGARDIVMIPSICDICGLNSITIPIFSSGVGAIVGMVEMRERTSYQTDKPVVALTMAGVTTECVMRVRELLDEKGFETIVCHCNVVGAIVLDEMAAKGKLDGVIDITPHDVGGMEFDGLMKCDEHRFEHIYKSGIPIMTLPGAVDFMLKRTGSKEVEALKDRALYVHTPFHTHIRTSYEEMYRVGKYLTEKHNECTGPNTMLVPLKGYSQQNKEGGLIYDEKANQGYIDAITENMSDSVHYVSKDMHINDPEFAEEIVAEFERLYEMGERSSKR